MAVLGAALESRHHFSTSDCSHFVHGLYERAGFSYGYASSTELYSGIPQFERVTTPQAGDLVVWRGHVGIAVNPVQHTFFSLLRSGRGVESYDSPYWRRRGHPRFFRYVIGNPDTGFANAVHNASLKPEGGEDADSSEGFAEDPISNRADGFSSASDRKTARIADLRGASAVIPQTVIINSSHPTPDQVRSAFLQACIGAEERLRAHDIFRSTQSVVVFDHFVVRKLHAAGTQGWAEVEIDQLASVTAGRSETRNHSERERWPLIRRANASWELTPPQNAIYVPQNVAAHLTAQRLAQLTKSGQSNADRNQKTELAQLLNVLLQK